MVFSGEIDRTHYPLRKRLRGIVLGSAILATVAAALVSPRTLPFLYAVMLAGFIADAAMGGRLRDAVPRRGPVFWHAAIFLLYAAVSATWGADPSGGLTVIGMAMLAAAAVFTIGQLLAEETRPNLIHMGEGLWIGLAVGLAYLLIELSTGQSIKIWIYNALGLRQGQVEPALFFHWSGNKLVGINANDLARNMAPLTLFVWPAFLVMLGTVRRPLVRALPALMILVAGTVVMVSAHETSKLAFAGGLVALLCASVAPRLAGRVAVVGWVSVCLLMLPAALLAHRCELHKAPWLQKTARHRIVIWNFTAEQTLKSPWLGAGARTTYVLGPRLAAQAEQRPDEEFKSMLSTHSHNIYLQTWYELGLVGVTLLTLLGLAILRAIRTLAREYQPYALATFASAALMAASSYGMWQTWFVCMFCVSAVLFKVGVLAVSGRPPMPLSGVDAS